MLGGPIEVVFFLNCITFREECGGQVPKELGGLFEPLILHFSHVLTYFLYHELFKPNFFLP